MRRIAPAVFALFVACGSGDDTHLGGGASSDSPGGRPGEAGTDSSAGAGDGPSTSSADAGDVDTSADAGADAASPGNADGSPDPCADASVPPSTLECAGLYSDFPTKTVSPLAKAYAPAVPLWSDGAVKDRWIELPPGQKIDVSDPNEWTFPVGTKTFKQFSYGGRRVETRLFQKIAARTWVHATYEWNADETATTISYGDTVPVDADGGNWVIPTPDQCDECHRGRSDRVLGFEQVLLGLDGATGLTLLQLVVQDLVTPAPTRVNLRIGDDGTGVDAPALGWLHVNCGVTCHNSNANSAAYGAKMLMRLDPSWLDGSRATSAWDPIRTTVGVTAVSGSVQGLPRILAGDPSGSLIIRLTSERGTLQMPPIASRVVDAPDVALVTDWIGHMPLASGAPQDAGADAGPVALDGGVGTGNAEAGGAAEGGTVDDAGAADSGVDAPSNLQGGTDATTDQNVGEAGMPADGSMAPDAATPDANGGDDATVSGDAGDDSTDEVESTTDGAATDAGTSDEAVATDDATSE
jgi:hypothetical protein